MNGDGSITLSSANAYYIEFDHSEGGGGQGAAVTYKLAASSDPATGAASLLTGNAISSAVPDWLVPQPIPHITNALVSASNVTLSGSNGLVNAQYRVLSSTSMSVALANWTELVIARFDRNGNFSISIPKGADKQRFYILAVP